MNIDKINYVTTIASSLLINLLIGFIFEAQANSLDNVIRQALITNPDFLITEASRHQADSNLEGSFSGYLPNMDLAASYGKDKNTNNTTRAETGDSLTLTKRESNFTLTQMLFDGFAVKNDVEAKGANVKSSAKTVFSTMQDVAIEVVNSYLDVLRQSTVVDYAKENLSSHQEIFQQIQLRVESGIGSRADLDQATGRLALARTNLLTEQANLRDSQASYIRNVGKFPENLFRPEIGDDVLPNSEKVAVAMALQYHPNLSSAEADVVSARANKRASKSSYFPTLSLEIAGSDSKNVGGSRTDTDNLSAMVRFNYNIFRGGADRAREKTAIWALEEAKEVKNQVKRQVEQQVRISWNAFSSSRAQLQYRKLHKDSTQSTRDAYQDQFTIGQRTLLDLLDSENELFSAKTAFISAQFSELTGKYQVLHSMGRLTEYFKIPAPDTAIYKLSRWVDGF